MWYQSYLDGKLSIEGLDQFAPLIARAIRKQRERNQNEQQS
jgi:hypothetical protein